MTTANDDEGVLRVRDLRRALADVPDDAIVYVRIEHDLSFSPGDEGYEPACGVFCCPGDNSLNIE
ncbi:hypothetical protein [Paraburkholderia sacchari]|uniref:hypothetical protein n=1 Tax=Paraburkholderia sacchari TaxID=159450 RepID=UPI000543DB30|nr:hypothetical protein [Paraburkholderia sacchari]NLP64356.1 hypothetical protein [Paraburkholderia sacchari]